MVLVSCASSSPPPKKPVPPQPPSVRYFMLLQEGIDRSRSQMPAMIDSAQHAAKRVVNGGRLFVAGSQPDFMPELTSRAGGLVCVTRAPTKMIEIERSDVVLYSARSFLTLNDHLQISRLRERGVYVIAFASKAQTGTDFPPDVLIDSGPDAGLPLGNTRLCPADGVINILSAWAWTGEFISACTRLGKMPVVYQSVHLEGGRERAKKYAGVTFHNDVTIAPIQTGVMGMAYLDHVERYLAALRAETPDQLQTAGRWLREATPARSALDIQAHMFPAHYQDSRAPQPFGESAQLDPSRPPPAAGMNVELGYQQPPQLAIDAAHVHHTNLLYSSVQRGRDDDAQFICYIDPHWPMTDACVEIKGYDVPALPASGVVQAAIYWGLVAETYPPAQESEAR
jgi:hypothetical protein